MLGVGKGLGVMSRGDGEGCRWISRCVEKGQIWRGIMDKSDTVKVASEVALSVHLKHQRTCPGLFRSLHSAMLCILPSLEGANAVSNACNNCHNNRAVPASQTELYPSMCLGSLKECPL
jgi:hypothetical protein